VSASIDGIGVACTNCADFMESIVEHSPTVIIAHKHTHMLTSDFGGVLMIRLIDHKKMGRGIHGWLDTYFHFSFAEYHNPDNRNKATFFLATYKHSLETFDTNDIIKCMCRMNKYKISFFRIKRNVKCPPTAP